MFWIWVREGRGWEGGGVGTYIAEDIEVGVDAVVVVADRTGLAGGRDGGVAAADDLVVGCGDVVGGCELERGVATRFAPGVPGFACRD